MKRRMASAILAVKLDKCRHLKTDIKHLSTFSHKLTIKDVFYMYHPSPSIDHKYHVEAEASQEANIQHKQGSVSIPVDTDVTVGDLNSFGTKSLTLKCVSDPDLDIVQAAAEEATVKASNSFEILMAKGRTFPVKRKKR